MLDYYYNPIRIKSENLLFLGCPHLNHARDFILEPRGFKEVEEANETFISRWNNSADHDTIGFLLGDVMFGSSGLDGFEGLLDRLNFNQLYVMSGNHCAGYKQMFRQAMKVNGEPVYSLQNGRTINLIPNYLEIIAGDGAGNKKMNMVLSHYPHVVWNGNGKGSVHLYSHCHNSLRKSELGRLYEANGKCLEASVERAIEINEGLPFSLQDIRQIMADKSVYAADHHTSKTQNPF